MLGTISADCLRELLLVVETLRHRRTALENSYILILTSAKVPICIKYFHQPI